MVGVKISDDTWAVLYNDARLPKLGEPERVNTRYTVHVCVCACAYVFGKLRRGDFISSSVLCCLFTR